MKRKARLLRDPKPSRLRLAAMSVHVTVLGMGIVLMLGACGGRTEDAAASPDHRAGVPAASSRNVATVPMPNGSAPDDDMAQVKQQIALLRREVADIRQQLARAPSIARSTQATPDPRRDPNARAEAERAERLRVVASESAFRSEREDARWSQGTVATVRAALADSDESIRNQVRSIECRSQSCRVEISADASGTLARDLPILLSRLGQSLPNVTAGQIDQGDGRQAMVLYLAR